ncbi:copper chaperone PCu(A)C [Gammaproteobacteria bacterium]|nr:copper chaperone PCu(A)C [Gammaproteobacteria bacterium]
MKNLIILALLSFICSPSWAAETVLPTKQQSLTLAGGYLRTMPPGQTVTAGFLIATNYGEVDCQIVSAQSPLAERIEFHAHLHADGMMQMRPMKTVMVAAGKTIRFEPGALHLMFFNVNKRLVDGQTVPLQLNTDNCGSHSLTLDIRSVLRPMMDHS